MRSVRQEFLSLLSASALPLAIAVSFPYGAVRFKGVESDPDPDPFAAFVVLTEEQELRATQAVKASWQGDSGGLKHIRANLTVGELPEEVHGPVLELSMEALRMPMVEIPVDVPPLPPSMAAAKPGKIPSDAVVTGGTPVVFGREELLKID